MYTEIHWKTLGSSRPHSRSLELTDRSGTTDFPLVIHSSLTMGLSHTVSKKNGDFDRKKNKNHTRCIYNFVTLFGLLAEKPERRPYQMLQKDWQKSNIISIQFQHLQTGRRTDRKPISITHVRVLPGGIIVYRTCIVSRPNSDCGVQINISRRFKQS